MKTAIVIGAGPAGLTAGYELLARPCGIRPILLEATDRIGGISCTICHHGNRIDIGGHRFFSKSDVVMDWWAARMPLQGAPSRDDRMLGRERAWANGGPDPEREDRVMLIRQRISRIYYLRRFFDYPISLKFGTIANLGLIRTARAAIGYAVSRCRRRPREDSLEDFLVNRFGLPLYRMFFEDYTRKVWGVHPREISAQWGAQRIRGLSLSGAILSALKRMAPQHWFEDLRQKNTETSLIDRFCYPKLGPGQLWECVAGDIREMGGEIRMRHKVTGICVQRGRVTSVTAVCDGVESEFPCDYCLSSMPVRDLVDAMPVDGVSPEVRRVAAGLPYRNFMTVGVLVRRLRIRNTTRIKTIGGIVPDTWIYIQEPNVKLCRLQIFNNWSPYMVADQNAVWLGLEYICSAGDELWKMADEDFTRLAVGELVKIGIADQADVLDTCRIRVENAYPAYFGTYAEFDKVREHLDGVENLYCIGRNGQHRYNNQDHSMLTAMEAVRCIRGEVKGKASLWTVNTEREYQEKRR